MASINDLLVLWDLPNLQETLKKTAAVHLKRSTGGKLAPIYRTPFFVSITMGGQHFCCGAFITTRSVLTAAHCLVDRFYEDYRDLVVVSRIDKKNAAGTHHQIDDTATHPEFVWDYGRNDIGVVNLLEPVKWSIERSFVALPTEELKLPENATLIAFNTVKDSEDDFYLNELELQIRSIESCPGLDANDYIIYSNEFCGLVGNGKCTGKGDSGGTIIYKRRLVGIFSATCNLNNRYSIVANVYKSLDFINRVKRF